MFGQRSNHVQGEFRWPNGNLQGMATISYGPRFVCLFLQAPDTEIQWWVVTIQGFWPQAQAQCGKTQETVKKIELTKDLWNMNDYNVKK